MFIRQNEQEVIDNWLRKMLVYLSFFLFFSHQLYIADDKYKRSTAQEQSR